MTRAAAWLRARLRAAAAALHQAAGRAFPLSAFPLSDVPLLDPSHGIAGPDGVEIRGRVLPAFCRYLPRPEGSRWCRALRLAGLLAARPVPDIAVEVAGERGVSDAAGRIALRLSGRDLAPGWGAIPVEIAGQPATRTAFPVFRVDPGARLGVIADIDEALVKGAGEPGLRGFRSVLTGTAPRRSVHPDAVVLIDYLAAHGSNPVVHASAAPWPLQAVLHDVLDRAAYDAGPLFLRDTVGDGTASVVRHKTAVIDMIMAATWPLPFTLIGNTRPDDVAAYLKACQRHGGRMVAVILRHGDAEVDDRAAQMLADIRRMGVTAILCATLDTAVTELERAGIGPQGQATP